MTSDKPRRKPSSGGWLVDEASLTTIQVPRDVVLGDEPATIPNDRRPVIHQGVPDGEGEVITVTRPRRSPLAPPLEDEPVTAPMARRSPLAAALPRDAAALPRDAAALPRDAEAEDDTVTNRMSSGPPSSREMGAPAPRPSERPIERPSERPSDWPSELQSDEEDDDVPTVPVDPESGPMFDLDSLMEDVSDSFERGPAFPSVAPSWPAGAPSSRTPGPVTPSSVRPSSVRPSSVRPSPVRPVGKASSDYPGRAFGAQQAPTAQLDRPEGPSVGARAVSVLVAVAVISLVLLAAAMIVTERSGVEALLELLKMIGLR